MTRRKLPRVRIGLGRPGHELTQIPLAEYNHMDKIWHIWLSYNLDVSAGTYIELLRDGTAFRVTIEPDGVVRDYIAIS